MSFKKGSFYFLSSIRNEMREKLGLKNKFVMIYTGNAYYSWQNVFRTIEIFKLIKEKVNSDSFLILLIKKEDFVIANEFIERLNINQNDFILTNCKSEEIGAFLNAADVGVSLRHNHIMNTTTPSGKILEYLGSGLPVITTKGMGEISNIVEEKGFGVVLDNMDNDDEIIEKIMPFLQHNDDFRIGISNWANLNISTDAKITDYVQLLKKLLSH